MFKTPEFFVCGIASLENNLVLLSYNKEFIKQEVMQQSFIYNHTNPFARFSFNQIMFFIGVAWLSDKHV